MSKQWPKIGDEVVIKVASNQYIGDLKYISNDYIILTQGIGEQHFHSRSVKIEPVKSPEEVERDRVIDEMGEVFFGSSLPCKALYDAGYRKVVPLSYGSFYKIWFDSQSDKQAFSFFTKEGHIIEKK